MESWPNGKAPRLRRGEGSYPERVRPLHSPPHPLLTHAVVYAPEERRNPIRTRGRGPNRGLAERKGNRLEADRTPKGANESDSRILCQWRIDRTARYRLRKPMNGKPQAGSTPASTAKMEGEPERPLGSFAKRCVGASRWEPTSPPSAKIRVLSPTGKSGRPLSDRLMVQIHQSAPICLSGAKEDVAAPETAA